ncbi:hypothetical protein HDU76_009540, partial [Blyttiomyces sp. JEL0837]
SIPHLSEGGEFDEPSANSSKGTEGWDDDFDIEPEPTTAKPADGALKDLIGKFEKHLDVMDILSKYGVHVTLGKLASPEFQDAAYQRQLVNRLSKLPVKEGGFSDEEWEDLVDDLLGLVKSGVFSSVPTKDVLGEVLRMALSDARFILVKAVLSRHEGLVSEEVAESLVLDAAREYYDNADSGNMNEGFLKLALECLWILPDSRKAQTEIELIEATHQICRLFSNSPDAADITPLPIQIRLMPDRLDLIATYLNRTNVSRTTEVTALINIGKKLYGGSGALAGPAKQRNQEVELRVRGMLAHRALDLGDLKLAIQVCDDILRASVNAGRTPWSLSSPKGPSAAPSTIEEAWRVCLRLLTEAGDQLTEEFRWRLIAFALEWCEARSISEVLDLSSGVNLAGKLKDVNTGGVVLGGGVETAEHELRARLDILGGDRMENETDGEVTELPVHEFYEESQQVLGKRALYGFYDEEDDDVNAEDERSDVLATLMHIHLSKVLKRDVRGLKPEQARADELTLNQYLMDLANTSLRAGDSGFALGVMMHSNDDSAQGRVFESLSACRPHDNLAVYYQAVRFLSELASGCNPDFLKLLSQQEATRLIDAVEEIAAQLPHISTESS